MNSMLHKIIWLLALGSINCWGFDLGGALNKVVSDVASKPNKEAIQSEKVESSEVTKRKAWIDALELHDKDFFSKQKNTDIIDSWKNQGFSPEEAKEWREVGIGLKGATDSKKKGISAKEANAIRTTEDPIKKHFDAIAIKMTEPKKDDITFADIGHEVNFQEMVEKICNIKSFKTIDGVSKEDYCMNDSKYKRAFQEVPNNFFEKEQWKTMYTRDILDKYNIKNEDVYLTNVQAQTITASPLTIKGVDFSVNFTYVANRNGKVLKGMLIDGTVPMVYYTITNEDGTFKRFVTSAVLESIKLVPVNKEAYITQMDSIIEVFIKKYPNMSKPNFVNRGTVGYSYYVNKDKFLISFSSALPEENHIIYSFSTSNYGAEYLKLYDDKVKKELNTKGDDSGSI